MNRIRAIYKYLFVFGLQLALLAFNSRFDPDPHHDGLIFAGAVASADGLFPNRDFFAQYGPLTPYIQGLFLQFTSATLFNLRLLMAILLAVNGLILFYIASKLRGTTLALILTLIWLVELSARIPWPSILSTTILLLSFILLLEFKSKSVQLTGHRMRIVLSGLLLGFTPFIRIHNLLVIFILCISLILLRKSTRLLFLSLSYLGGLLVGIVILVFNSGFTDFVTQCILWPIEKYATPDLTKSYLVGVLWYPTISIIVLGYIMYILRNFGTLRTHSRLVPFVTLAIFWIMICVGLVIPRDGYLSLRNPKIIYIDSSYNFAHFIGYASAGACLFYLARSLFRRSRQELDLVVGIFALCSLSQLYPLYDQVHLWFITPILAVCALLFMRNIEISNSGLKALTIGTLPFILVLSSFAVVDWFKPRATYSSSILSGMSGDTTAVKNIDSTIDLLRKSSAGVDIIFSCANGLYAAYDGVYRSKDGDYVDWSPGFEGPISGEAYFVCDIPIDQFKKLKNVDNLISTYRYKIDDIEYYSAILITR